MKNKRLHCLDRRTEIVFLKYGWKIGISKEKNYKTDIKIKTCLKTSKPLYKQRITIYNT